MTWRAGFVLLSLSVLAGCTQDHATSVPATVPVTEVVVARQAPSGSVLDALDAKAAAGFAGSRRELAELLINPASVGEYRLSSLQVDDPNGDGRVDDRWYPPRLISGSCQVKVDSAPAPVASASFVPGDPEAPMDDDPLGQARAVMSAAHAIAVEIRVFDDAEQRDGFASVIKEFYGATGTMGCDNATSAPTVDGLGLREVDPYETGFPAYAVSGRLVFAKLAVTQYEIGSRVLLTVTVQLGMLKGANSEPDAALARPAIDAQVARLTSLGYAD